MNGAKVAYKPVGIVMGALSGVVAGTIFKQVWKVAGHEEDAPKAMDEESRWREVLIASAVQGAIFAVVKAAANRGGAVAVHRVTGKWPN